MNPHERRRPRPDRDDGMRMAGVGPLGWEPMRYTPPRVLDLEDLEAIAYRHRSKGVEEGKASRDEEIQNARREAWDEGFGEGEQGGMETMLNTIDERVGERVRHASGELREQRRKLEGVDLATLPTEEIVNLVTAVGGAATLLEQLVDAHHTAFAGDLPF